MFDWLKRQAPLRGAVWFRGIIPTTAESFSRLASTGLSVTPLDAGTDDRWRLVLEHPTWGKAMLTCPRDAEPIPPTMIDWSWLSEGDMAEARLGQTLVEIEVEAAGENMLRDRKNLIRFLDAVSGNDGVATLDIAAERLWSRADLQDELCHDADLDIESLFTVHMVTEDDGGPAAWIHTHGLAELGLVDFDLVPPRKGASYQGVSEGTRAIAGLILEGMAARGAGPVEIGYPGGIVELVDIDTFLREGTGHGADMLRYFTDDNEIHYDSAHLDNHVVICEPVSGGLLSRLFSSSRPRSSKFLWQEGEGRVMHVSATMSRVMAARARATYDVLRAMDDEFQGFDFSVLAKLGYVVDGGGADEREHLWFEVHGLGETKIDATLVNQPYNVASMNEGDRGRHPIDHLTDWAIFTPVGVINPHSFTTARMVREDPDGVREAMKAQR